MIGIKSTGAGFQQLDYDFLQVGSSDAIGHALRFTLSVPGVHTAIVGTAKQGRWQQNAQWLAQGNLTADEYAAIRLRWKERAQPDWRGLG